MKTLNQSHVFVSRNMFMLLQSMNYHPEQLSSCNMITVHVNNICFAKIVPTLYYFTF